MRVFDRVRELHLETLPETAIWRDKSFNYMSNRLFKYQGFCRRINIGLVKDISTKALLVAFISGMSDLQERKASRFAAADEWLEADEKFYMGIWNILCEDFAPEGKFMEPPPLVSEERRMVLGSDGNITTYNLLDKCEEYLSYAILNDVPKITSRNKVSYLMNLPKKGWLAQHHEIIKHEGFREYPIEKLLMVVLGTFRLDYLAKPAPTANYWIDFAYLTWEKLFHLLETDLATAQRQRAKYNKESK